MKTTKKVLSLMLAFMMIFGPISPIFADGNITEESTAVEDLTTESGGEDLNFPEKLEEDVLETPATSEDVPREEDNLADILEELEDEEALKEVEETTANTFALRSIGWIYLEYLKNYVEWIQPEDFDASFPSEIKQEVKTDRYIFRSARMPSLIDELTRMGTLEELFTEEEFQGYNDYTYILTLNSPMYPSELKRELESKRLNYFEYIHPDYILELDSFSLEVINEGEDKTQEETAVENESAPEVDIPETDPNTEPPKEDNEENIEKEIETEGENSEGVKENFKPENENETEETEDKKEEVLENKKGAVSRSVSDSEDFVTVVFIDTAIDKDHSVFENISWLEDKNYISDPSFEENSDDMQNYLHGTQMAGIAAQTLEEIPEERRYKEVRFASIQVFGSDGRAYTSDVIKALRYSSIIEADIINMSFSSADENYALLDAISNINALVVVSAGNEGQNIGVDIPALYEIYRPENMITVASVNEDYGLSFFSNYSNVNIDIAAQGNKVKAPLPGTEDLYTEISGTSAAAAKVTGAAAMYVGLSGQGYPNLKESLLRCTNKIDILYDYVVSGRVISISDIYYGGRGQNIRIDDYENEWATENTPLTMEEFKKMVDSNPIKSITAGGYSTAVVLSDGTVWSWGYMGYRQNSGLAEVTRSKGIKDAKEIFAQISDEEEYEGLPVSINSYTGNFTINTSGPTWKIDEKHTFAYLDSSKPLDIAVPNVEIEESENEAEVLETSPQRSYGKTRAEDGFDPQAVIKAVEAEEEIIALTESGDVWSFTIDARGNMTEPVKLEIKEISDISAGAAHFMAFSKENDQVYFWGSNQAGQIDPGNTNKVFEVPTLLFGEEIKVKIELKPYSRVAIDNINLYWIDNYGDLWTKSSYGDNILVKRENFGLIKEIYADYSQKFIALREDGSLWNEYGNPYYYMVGSKQNNFTEVERLLAEGTLAVLKDGSIKVVENDTRENLIKKYEEFTNLVSASYTQHNYTSQSMFFAEEADGKCWIWGDVNLPTELLPEGMANGYYEEPVQIGADTVAQISHSGISGLQTLVLDKAGNIYFYRREIDAMAKFETDIKFKYIHIEEYGYPILHSEDGDWYFIYNDYLTKFSFSEKIIALDSNTRTENILAMGEYGAVYKYKGSPYGADYTGEIVFDALPNNYKNAPVRVLKSDEANNLWGISDTVDDIDWFAFSFEVSGEFAVQSIENLERLNFDFYDEDLNKITLTENGFLKTLSVDADKIYYLKIEHNKSFEYKYLKYGIKIIPADLINKYESQLPTLAVGNAHTVKLERDGSVWVWGDNSLGQLANDKLSSSAYPVRVEGLEDVVAVYSGPYAVLVLKSDGTVWGWGYSLGGVLGPNTNGKVITEPVQISGIEDVKSLSIYTTGMHVLALKNDGMVYSWGSDKYGQLGFHTGMELWESPLPLYTLSDIEMISAGPDYSLALKADGTVWAWGDNTNHKISQSNDKIVYMPVQTPFSNVRYILATKHASYAVSYTDSLYAWNYIDNYTKYQSTLEVKDVYNWPNDNQIIINIFDGQSYTTNFGQYGYMDYYNQQLFTSVPELKEMAGGSGHAVAYSAETGRYYATGQNDKGQLGNNSTNNASYYWVLVEDDYPNTVEEIRNINNIFNKDFEIKGSIEYKEDIDWMAFRSKTTEEHTLSMEFTNENIILKLYNENLEEIIFGENNSFVMEENKIYYLKLEYNQDEEYEYCSYVINISGNNNSTAEKLLNITQGNNIYIALNAEGYTQADKNSVIVIIYDESKLKPVNLAVQSGHVVNGPTVLGSSFLEITEIKPGEITIKVLRDVASSNEWYGNITLLEFEAVLSGETSITLY